MSYNRKLEREFNKELASLKRKNKKAKFTIPKGYSRKEFFIIRKLSRYIKGLSYPEFLKTEYWKKVRLKVLKRDGFKCRVCPQTERLEVHHETYKHHGKEHLYLDDLITLCRDCHKEYHYNIEK